jgi:hypothetical protein
MGIAATEPDLLALPSLARRPLGSAVVRPANSFDRSHGDARFGRDLSVLFFQDRKRDRIMVVNASQRRLWYLAIGSLRTILVEHVEPDEFGARSRFLAHVSNFPSYACFLAGRSKAEQPPIPIRPLFDCRHLEEKLIRPRAPDCATDHEPGLFIGNNVGFGIGEIGSHPRDQMDATTVQHEHHPALQSRRRNSVSPAESFRRSPSFRLPSNVFVDARADAVSPKNQVMTAR